MDKEKRHLIMAEGDKLKDEYDKLAQEAIEKDLSMLVYAYVKSKEAILKYQLAILNLDAENKI